MNWQNTTLIVLSITLAVAAVVGSLARQLFSSIFELDEDIDRFEPVTSDPSPRAARDYSTGVGTPVHEAARSAPGEN